MNKPHLVILSGAGVSAESGLKTFRDHDGLWMGYRIEDVATPRAFAKDPRLVLDFYNKRRKEVAGVMPNAAHKAIAVLEKNYRVTVITQNIDDLHERGGSTHVLHLHGQIFQARSVNSDQHIVDIREDINPGDLASDGGQLRPHIVWFEEPVPMIEKAAEVVSTADIFVVIGTSLQVYPAAGLIDLVPAGSPIYVIDKKIPAMRAFEGLTTIEKTAAEGMLTLTLLLNCAGRNG